MKLAAVRVFVFDLEPALAFYEAVTGAPPTATDESSGYAVFGLGGVDVVVERVDRDADPDDIALVGRFTGLSFGVDDIVAVHESLAATGARFTSPPQRQAWGGTTATLADPAGNELQIVEYPA